jgi:Retrotransposon gag protein
MYSEAESVMMMMEVEEKIDATTQGEKSVHQYAAELRSLWADLDHYDRLVLQNPTNILSGRQYLERRQVAHFLKGLNVRFKVRRAAMCHLPSLPLLDEAIASMEQEEIRQKVMTGETTPVVRSPWWSRLHLLEKTWSVITVGKKDISPTTASNHATLVTAEEVEDRGVDVVVEEAEDVVDEQLLI